MGQQLIGVARLKALAKATGLTSLINDNKSLRPHN